MGILKTKSALFADRIVKLYKYLCSEKHENILSKQILRSGTSIGANVSEANFSSSTKDFIAKLNIAAKECAETAYWLKRLNTGGYISNVQFQSINADCEELGKMLTASIKTAKSRSG